MLFSVAYIPPLTGRYAVREPEERSERVKEKE